MDLDAAVRDGITFFVHKATEGTKIQHVHYGEALGRARAAGMPLLGAYLVVRTPGNNGHGPIHAQVDYALAYLDAQTPWWRTTPEFFLQVDTEHWGYDDVAPGYGVTACDLLRARTGKWVILYAPRWAYGDTIPGNYPLWASSYGANPAAPYRRAYPGDDSSGWAPYSGRTPTILQYGSRLTIGSQPTCDADAFRGTIDQFRALIVGDDVALTPDQARQISNSDQYLYEMAREQDPIKYIIFSGGVQGTVPNLPLQRAIRIETAVTRTLPDLIAQIQQPQAPTQEQVNAAVLNAMLDPRVQKGIGDAIASHLHVS